MCWHLWRYPQRREFDLWYAVDRVKEAKMVTELNDIVYAQREVLGDDWERYEVIPNEAGRHLGPEVDGTIPDQMPKSHRN